jgi:hypothetical protein
MTAEFDSAQPELQALADHYAATHHSPALIWGRCSTGSSRSQR